MNDPKICKEIKLAILQTKAAAHTFSSYASKVSANTTLMQSFQTNYLALVESNRIAMHKFSSTGIYLTRYKNYTNWLHELMEAKIIAIPQLVSKMLQGEVFANLLYVAVYKELNKDGSVLNIDKIVTNPPTLFLYSMDWDSVSSQAIRNAKLWLASEEAANVFAENNIGNNALCDTTLLLGIDNTFVDCNYCDIFKSKYIDIMAS